MIELDPTIVAVWYLQTTPTQDWLCAINEAKAGEEYLIQYRFRYYNDEGVWDSKDVKNWMSATFKGSKENAVTMIRSMAQGLQALGAEGKLYEIINTGDFQAFMVNFQAAPFVHKRAATDEERAKFGLDKQPQKG